MEVILVSEIEQLERMGESYRALLDKVGGIESLYYSLDYIRTSLETFKALGAALFFIVVREGDDLVAVVPFQRVRDGAFGSRRTINFWGGLNIYALNVTQKILADGFRPNAMDAAVSFLETQLKKEWDSIGLTWIRMEDENIQHFAARLRNSCIKPNKDHYYYFNTAVDLDDHLGSKKLREMKRCKRRLEEAVGKVDFVVKEEVDLNDFEKITSVHTARQEYKKNNGAFFCNPLENTYVRDLFKMWSARKCVHYYSLRVDGEPIAFWITTHAARVTYAFLMAFDTDFKTYSPSRLLAYDVFRYEAEHYDAVRIETAWGGNHLKENFSTGTYPLYDIELTSGRLRTRCILAGINLLFKLRRKCSALDSVLTTLKHAVGKH